MKKKIVIITGANSGIGKAASLLFAQMGHTVIMACRNVERSKKIRDEIVNISGNKNIFLMQVDMSSFSSIKNFCDEFRNQYDKLDILIHNAAYFNHGESYTLSEDGIEMTFATNVAGPFLMTQLFLEHLKKSDDARILNASSNIIKHYFSPKKEISLNNLQGIVDKNYKHSVYNCYRNSKMALLMLTFNLAEEYRNSGIKVFSIQINGAKMSKETLKKFKLKWRLIALIQNIFFPPAEFMAEKYYEISTSDKFKNETGCHINQKLEIMKAGPEKPSVKDIIGTNYYPRYADVISMQQKIRDLCRNLTKKFM